LSVWHSHATSCDAACAAAPWVIALLGDGLWFVVLILVRSRLPKLKLWLGKRVPSWGPAPTAATRAYERVRINFLHVPLIRNACRRLIGPHWQRALAPRKGGGAYAPSSSPSRKAASLGARRFCERCNVLGYGQTHCSTHSPYTIPGCKVLLLGWKACLLTQTIAKGIGMH
jgi:hypothetical protein